MRSLLPRGNRPKLDDRLAALNEVVELGAGRLGSDDDAAARVVAERASERMGLGLGVTVVALGGATGSGKSSLFNALSGSDLSDVGVRRPTTGVAHASVWGDSAPSEILDWLGVPRRHHVASAELDGLVLLDLPDHDSTEAAHRLEVDRLVQLVDIFVWVVDPQKYADAALHYGYLRPLASHAAVTFVVLNQVDRLSAAERRQCLTDLERLMRSDGLGNVKVLPTSARTGEGLDELRRVLGTRVKEEKAAAERLAADIDLLHERLGRYCSGRASAQVPRRERDRLVDTLADAAGVAMVTNAVGKAHRRDAALKTGWPFTRWLRRLRPDPLARLHLRRDSTGGPTSLPRAGNVQKAQVENAVRRVSAEASADLPEPWPDLVRTRATESTAELIEDLDRAVGRADLGAEATPRWWILASAIQTLLATAAVIGFAWLTVLFVLEWFQIPRPPTPEVEELPWPTLLLIGGLLAGFLLSFVFSQFARVGAARRRRRAHQRLRAEIESVADADVVAPIEDELAAYSGLCDALARLAR